jgi:hypothetical protein
MELKVLGSVNETEYDAIISIFATLSATIVFCIENCFVDIKGISTK